MFRLRFSDVVGYEEIKEDLKNRLRYFTEQNVGKGCLFQGPNGSGKTFLAKAIAGEAKVPFCGNFHQ